jgi:hypothetical protein
MGAQAKRTAATQSSGKSGRQRHGTRSSYSASRCASPARWLVSSALASLSRSTGRPTLPAGFRRGAPVPHGVEPVDPCDQARCRCVPSRRRMVATLLPRRAAACFRVRIRMVACPCPGMPVHTLTRDEFAASAGRHLFAPHGRSSSFGQHGGRLSCPCCLESHASSTRRWCDARLARATRAVGTRRQIFDARGLSDP